MAPKTVRSCGEGMNLEELGDRGQMGSYSGYDSHALGSFATIIAGRLDDASAFMPQIREYVRSLLSDERIWRFSLLDVRPSACPH